MGEIACALAEVADEAVPDHSTLARTRGRLRSRSTQCFVLVLGLLADAG